MDAEERQLLDLAARVSDGNEVDWDAAERSAEDDESRRVIRHLRLVQGLAEVHRSRDETPASPEKLLQMTASIRASELVAKAGEVPSGAGERWGRLEIREKLGQGAYGQVYRAWDANLQHEVALKLIDPAAHWRPLDEEEYLREGRLLARLRHPNVITVHAAEIHDGKVGISMELVQGSTLSRVMREQGRFGAREAALIGLDLCRALAAVHGAGLVHRDVKAQNVMRGDGGRILLMDFGAGRELEDLAERPGKDISGTPLYMAPETILGNETTPRSDLYSLGVLLYYLVTGGYPVRASTMQELAEQHRRGDTRLLRDARSDLPQAFVKVVERALAGDAEQRFGSAGEMEQALSAALGVDGPAPSPVATATPGQQTAPGDPRSRFPRLPIFAAGALAVVTLALLGWWALHEWIGTRSVPAETQSVAASTYQIEAALYRMEPEGRGSTRLSSGSRLKIGDLLSLEIEGSVPLHVYVFNRDERGNAVALFPMPDMVLQNPLPADVKHVLPGARREGERLSWKVDTPGGREHFMVLASPERLLAVEEELSKLPLPRSGAVARPLPPEAMVRLRGIGGLAETPQPAEGGSADRLFEMVREMSGSVEQVEGIWQRKIELLNPEE